nr:cell wall-binding repeat-containing protein [uncultured Peptostreptococcus sp.]
MKRFNFFRKRSEEKNKMNLSSENKAIKKLSVGILSCALSCTMFLNPLAVGAEGTTPASTSTGASVSFGNVSITNQKQRIVEHQPIDKIVITTFDPSYRVTISDSRVYNHSFETLMLLRGLRLDEANKTIYGTYAPLYAWGKDEEVRTEEYKMDYLVLKRDVPYGSENADPIVLEFTVLRDTDEDGDPDITDPDDDGDGISDEDEIRNGTDPKDNDVTAPKIYGRFFDENGDYVDEVPLKNMTVIDGTEENERSYIELLTDDISIREIGATGLPPGATYTEFLITTTPKINDWSKTEEKRDYEITVYAIDPAGNRGESKFIMTVLRDTDRDGIPDTTDTDDDGDGFTDAEELAKGSDPKDPKSTPATIPAPSPSPSRPSNPSTSRPTSPVANDTATNRPETGRIDGRDRIETAINISKQTYNKAKTVIVVRHDLFPDSMTASVLAKLKDAPILLNPTDKLDSRVGDEIKRLGAEEVIIVGGQNSVSERVREDLKAFDSDKNVERIAGADRYGTSEMVAKRVVGITGKKNTGVVASGQVFPDALSVGTFASREGYPILLVKKDSVPSQIQNAIKDLEINKTYIAGGTNTISKSTEANLPNVVERMAGNTRYETSVAIAKSKFGASKEAYVASGEEFADALVISPVSGKYNRPTLLVSTKAANNGPVRSYVKDSKISKLTAIGGQRYVPSSIISDLIK